MRVVLSIFLFFQAVFSDPRIYSDCDQNCESKYDAAALTDACVKGCHSSVGLEAKIDEFNVNLNCESFCNHFSEDSLKSACYGGCTYVPPAKVERPKSVWPMLGALCNLFFSKVSNFFKVSKNSETTNPSAVEQTHIRIIIPGGFISGPHMMDDENMGMMMNAMHGLEVEPPNSINIIQPPLTGHGVDAPNFSRTLCFRARAAFHHLATHPLFMASIIIMFVTSVSLLIFACSRLSARRARRVVFERQYRRMPAFFRSPSMRVNLLAPQPPSDDEAPELPPKEPIV